MRKRSVYTRRSDRLDVAMTPMIDVVFMLLIFFVWTSSFRVVELLLPSSLLTASGAAGQAEADPELQDLERVVVQLTWNEGQPLWRVNESPLGSLQEVRERLQSVAGIRADLPVVVDAADQVPLGHVIDVYDCARQVGFERVQFAVNEEV
jgi:biopolymer transport protein ExbD